MTKQKHSQPVSKEELDELIIAAGKRLGLLPPTTSEDVARSTAVLGDGAVPDWVRDPVRIARIMAEGPQGKIAITPRVLASRDKELAMAARAGTGKLTASLLAKMSEDRLTAQAAAALRKPRRDGL